MLNSILLSSIVNSSNHAKSISLSYQKCEITPTLINLHPNEYSLELRYYPFAVKLESCAGRCNTFNDLSNKLRAPYKREDLNLSVFKTL